uniref:Uncharacterized protein n=1 Tax=Arundo donax TaxID=35708 RepID=A0A0A9FM22_ARUDO
MSSFFYCKQKNAFQMEGQKALPQFQNSHPNMYPLSIAATSPIQQFEILSHLYITEG